MADTASQRTIHNKVGCDGCVYYIVKHEGSLTKKWCRKYRCTPTVRCYDYKESNARKDVQVRDTREGGGER